ncbi:putative mitochondrial processing peptidase alpha [Phaeomoniella chlamydospora]|uniref:Mitochondrial-processing peptidase subunit alpha n=1 Tax=Phaeomoniella chlamydospora TaxID=158046 RepID=A0A0G2GBZ6_PHACM|nr:putative mitochondrial processing peptidase alpha [Phaeomoniella chlamydospora]
MKRSAVQALKATKAGRTPGRSVTRSFATIRDPGQKVGKLSPRSTTCSNKINQDPAELDQITELPNGVRVATESLPGPFSGVGVYVDAGSRYEDASLRGVSHIIDRLAFKSTKSKTADDMIEQLERLGGNVQCASSREALMYQSATFNSAVPTTIGLLAETIRDPLITDEEVDDQLKTAEYEIGEIWAKPDLILPELVHMAAYKDNTLGNPLLCPKERLLDINKQLVQKYRDVFYQPERIVVAFAGVPHEEAVKLTKQYFGDMKRSKPLLSQTGADSKMSSSSSSTSSETSSNSSLASTTSSSSYSSSSSSGILSKIPLFKNLSTSASSNADVVSQISPLQPSSSLDLNQSSHYTGGYLALPPIPPPVSPLQIPLTHIHIAFEALPISSPDIYALATLQTLLGGGGSFSAGGPGKGMYSRLYTNVLNQHGWVESCAAFNHSYTDSGLFGIAASCSPYYAHHMVDVICRELQSLTLDSGFSALQPGEVSRAKNQLRSSLLMNLESRLVELEDLGRQVQVHGKKIGVKEMCAQIDALTVEDLRRVARSVFGGKVENNGKGTGAPTVVIQEGEEEGSANRRGKENIRWEDVEQRIKKWKLGRL